MPTPVWKKVEKTELSWRPIVYGAIAGAIFLEIILAIIHGGGNG